MELELSLAILSLLLFLGFAELSAVCLKRLAPFLAAWLGDSLDTSASGESMIEAHPTWGRLAILGWAIGGMVPLLAFALGALLYFPDSPQTAMNLFMGATIGGNIIAVGLLFGLILYSSQLTFFRIRTMSSPIFLFLGTIAFIVVALDAKISKLEGVSLWLIAVAYAFYFRSYSSDWRYYQRQRKDATAAVPGGFLVVLSIVCMGAGFFVLAALSSYPFLMWLLNFGVRNSYSDLLLGTTFMALLLNFPWILRVLFTLGASSTQKAMSVTNITHTCFLNLLLLPGIIALLAPIDIAPELLNIDIPVLFFFTGVFAATLLIEKQEGRVLPGLIIFLYFIYLATGVLR